MIIYNYGVYKHSTHSIFCAANELYILKEKMQKMSQRLILMAYNKALVCCVSISLSGVYFFEFIYFLSNIFIKNSNSFYCYLEIIIKRFDVKNLLTCSLKK